VKAKAKWLWLLPLLLVSGMASADSGLSMQFVTYDGYQETVDAFTRLALIFSDNTFLTFITVFALTGVTGGLMVKGVKMHMNEEGNPIGWLIPILAGGVVLKGLVLPTGTMYIYDPVLNATATVGGVPDLVLMIAGGLNEVEEQIVNVVDTASASAYTSTNGTMPFTLLYSALNSAPDQANLGRSAQQYYQDCGTFAIAIDAQRSGGNQATLQELLRSSTDLYTTFAKFTNDAIQTVYYPISTDTTYPNDAGIAMTCTADWAQLGPNLSSQSVFQSMENTICQNSGYSITDANQLAQCDSAIASLANTTLGVTTASTLTFMRSVFLGQSIVTALQSGDFAMSQSQIMNRQVMTESLGSAQAMAEWIPKLRAFTTAMVIGMVPLLALFFATPLLWKALGLIFGLFAFLVFWGIGDAIASQMANDAAVNALAQIAHYNLGFDAIINMPEGAIKSLGIFGKARAMGFTMATVAAGALMQFGGGAISQAMSSWSQDVQNKGEDAARKTVLPEERGGFIQNIVTGAATESSVRQYGYANAVAGQARGMQENASWARSMNVDSRMTGGASTAAERTGAISAGDTQGRINAIARATGGPGGGPGSVPSVDRMMAGQMAQTEFNTSKAFGHTAGERMTTDAMKQDAFTLGRAQGSFSAGGTFGQWAAYAGLNETSTLTGAGAVLLGMQDNGSRIGQISAEQGRPTDKVKQYIDSQHEFATTQLAKGGWLSQHAGSAATTGRGEAVNSFTHSAGTLKAEKIVKDSGLIEGAEYHQLQHADRAIAASQSAEGLAGAAEAIARVDVAGQLANANVTRTMAGAIGLNPDVVQNLVAAKTEQGSIKLAIPLTADTKSVVVDNLQSRGLIDSETSDLLRDPNYNGAAYVTFDKAGNAVAAQVDAGNRATLSQSTSIDSSVRRDFSDITSYATGPQGGLGILKDDHLAKELQKSFRGTGYDKDDDVQYAATIAQVAQALHEKGVDMSVSDVHNVIQSERLGLSGSLGGSLPMSGASAGASLGGGIDRAWNNTDSTSTTVSGNTLLAQAIVESTRQQANLDTWERNGPELMNNSNRSDEAANSVALRQQELIVEQINHYANDAKLHASTKFDQDNSVGQERVHDEDVRTSPSIDVIQKGETQRLLGEPKL